MLSSQNTILVQGVITSSMSAGAYTASDITFCAKTVVWLCETGALDRYAVMLRMTKRLFGFVVCTVTE